MQQQIKFRALDKKHDNKMWPVTAVSFMETGEMYAVEVLKQDSDGKPYRISLAPDMFELVEYTGLKDKNKKDIYEGDIVLRDGNPLIVTYRVDLGTLYSGPFFLRKYDQKNVEVIGNIYENPDLLSKEAA